MSMYISNSVELATKEISEEIGQNTRFDNTVCMRALITSKLEIGGNSKLRENLHCLKVFAKSLSRKFQS